MRAKKTIICSFVVGVIICCGFLGALPASGQAYDWHWAFNRPPLFPTNEWGAVTNDCQLGLRVLKFQFVSGEDIETAIVIRNVGDKHLKYFDIGEVRYEMIVRRADGQTVPYTDSWARDKDAPHPVSFRAVLEALDPHQESQQICWVNVTKRNKMDATGMYVITAKQYVVLDEEGKSEPLRFDLLSNPVTITIVAPKPKP